MTNSSSGKDKALNTDHTTSGLLPSVLSLVITISLLVFVLQVFIGLIVYVVFVMYASDTNKIVVDQANVFNNILTPLISTISLVISGIAAYYLIKQFKAQTEMNRSQMLINERQDKELQQSLYINQFNIYNEALDEVLDNLKSLEKEELHFDCEQMDIIITWCESTDPTEMILSFLNHDIRLKCNEILPIKSLTNEQLSHLFSVARLILNYSIIVQDIVDNSANLFEIHKRILKVKIIQIASGYLPDTLQISKHMHFNYEAFLKSILEKNNCSIIDGKIDSNCNVDKIKSDIGLINKPRLSRIMINFLQPLQTSYEILDECGVLDRRATLEGDQYYNIYKTIYDEDLTDFISNRGKNKYINNINISGEDFII